ncbi:RecQ family ATP-dependent DNA helicase [Aureibacter tunicatorum]|uniref:ATP-dependent DNA helicase RecQ n=1 Tax=Aureibacter tunicatorum TaxID=866807 RepID=A0AAE4BSQ9_9BACT|nr:RecQ family ATP-dependent DNA helicase [Aureibacter tunicatorum]MDR6239125.1 ATP-dependent DNA helicase RecQ [Aureibacter tunicatorum]BDD04949.1 ATP-dependent DNA helicase RecQ [Aureibacter tunicatorum]
MMKPKEALKRYWGYDSFRDLQLEIINYCLAGKDTLALLPTGGGKSICFQVPAMCKEGICIVVSPLIALMKDQVDQLTKRGIRAVAIHSGMTKREIDVSLDNCKYGDYKFLYVSPERLKTELFIERAKQMNVSLIAVDEAHCISQWGYDFRPSYLQIEEFRSYFPEVNVIALTATATKEVREDICGKLNFKNHKIFFKSFYRKNLSYSVRKTIDKERKLVEILSKVKGSAVVYVRNRKRCKEVAHYLVSYGVNADFYHAGLLPEERGIKQQRWISGSSQVMVATNAFGMGIDKPDVRVVAHLDLPDTLEAYYQEAGRAGRDEKKAYAVILATDYDAKRMLDMVGKSYPEIDELKKTYQFLANYFKVAVGSSFMASYDFDISDFCDLYHLEPYGVFQSLKKLEEQNLILFNEAYNNPSKLFIKVSNQALYEFQLFNEMFDLLIKAMLRIYGGELFTDYKKISESQLASLLQKSVRDIRSLLRQLHERQIIDYIPNNNQPKITYLTQRQEANSLSLDLTAYEKRKKEVEFKGRAVVKYFQNDEKCRSLQLQSYFGEQSNVVCGICDVCVEEKKATKSIMADLDVIKTRIMLELSKGALDISALSGRVKFDDQKAFEKAITNLLETRMIEYNNQGRLVLSGA